MTPCAFRQLLSEARRALADDPPAPAAAELAAAELAAAELAAAELADDEEVVLELLPQAASRQPVSRTAATSGAQRPVVSRILKLRSFLD